MKLNPECDDREFKSPPPAKIGREGRGLFTRKGCNSKISVAPYSADLTPQLACSEAQSGEHRLKVEEVLPYSPPAKHPTTKDLAMEILTQFLTEPRCHHRPSKCATYMPESSVNDMRLHFQPTPAILWFIDGRSVRGQAGSERI